MNGANAAAAPTEAKPRAHLERLRGISLKGWVWDPRTPGQEKLTLRTGAFELEPHVVRSARADVNQALGIDVAKAGFALEMPAGIWQAMSQSGEGLTLLVNGSPCGHPPLWPRPPASERWKSYVESATEPHERARREALARQHAEAASRWAPALKASPDAMPEWQAPAHVEVEGVRHLRIVGWSTTALDAHAAEIDDGHGPIGAPLQRVERSDVAHALELDTLDVGFEVEIPGAIWQRVAAGEAASLRLRLRGSTVGGSFRIERGDLLQAVDNAAAIGEPGAQRLAGLLALEHLAYAGMLNALSATQRAWLHEVADGVGLGGWLGDGEAKPESRAFAWRPLPQPSRWGALLLRSRAASALALRVLNALQRRGSAAGPRLELSLTRRIGLFDRKLYALQLGDAAGATRPLRHYVTDGDARGLSPMALFDPVYYTRQLPGARHPGVNRLLHYALWGRFNGLAPCEWLDPAHYGATYRDVQARGIDAAAHFHDWGWREGRKPLPDFNGSAPTRAGVIRRMQREQADAAGNPLMRYLLQGLPERVRGPAGGMPPWLGTTSLDGRDFLDRAAWEALPPRPSQPTVDVVVPVYGGVQETLRCLWSVLTEPQRHAIELVVIDDRGPEPALARMLAWLAERKLITLHVNDENLGFVRSVNRGLALHPERDVVILNADAVVYGNWLDRLLAHAAQEPRAASITPLSNNATICSYPRTIEGNDELPPADARALDEAAAQLNAGAHVDTPTGVGFCMFMRRRTMEAVGLLDAERFGRGYGEENDWCLRAARAGWRNLIAADVYVTHAGSVSFGTDASPRARAAVRTLLESWPDYQQRIDTHIKRDPLRAARARLDIARLRRAAGDQGFVLSVNHGRGGGTARHEREQAQRCAERGLQVLRLRPDADGSVQLLAPQLANCPNLHRLPIADDGLLGELLALLPLREIHLHHLADFAPSLAEALPRLAERTGARLVVTLHDYLMLCPRINLVDGSGRYCGEPDDAGCDRCLRQDEAGRRAGGIVAWRARHEHVLRAAGEIRVPDADMLPRLQRRWPGLRIDVHPHEPALEPLPPLPAERVRRVLVIGALSRVKGHEVLLALAACRTAREAGMQFVLLGYSPDDAALRSAGVEVLGAYDDETLQDRIAAIAPDLIFIPSVWPETYCYVLSSAMVARRRVAVFDLGAQARRARAADVDAIILPLTLANRPDDLAAALLA